MNRSLPAAVAARSILELLERELGVPPPAFLERALRRWRGLPWPRQRRELPALYRAFEEHVVDVAGRGTRAHVRGILRAQHPSLLELPDLALLLMDPEEEERRVRELFVERLRRLVGRSGGDVADVLDAVEAESGAAGAARLCRRALGEFPGLEAALLEILPPRFLDAEQMRAIAARRRERAARERLEALRRGHDELAARVVALEEACDLAESSSTRSVAELRSMESSFRALIDGLPDMVFVMRGAQLVFVNRAATAAFGAEVGALAEALATMEGARETLLPRRNAPPLPVEVAAMRVGFDGAPATLLVARDVSERKRLQERMALADRMVALGTLAAGVAHEINNPLTYVMVNLESLSEALHHPSAQADFGRLHARAREALEGAERIRGIVRDLAMFARGDSGATRPVEMARVVNGSLQMARNQLHHRARVIKRYHAAPPVLASEGRLVQVFVNVLVNAAQAIPAGEAAHNRIDVGIRTDEQGRAEVTIRDTGHGIPSEVRNRVFDPFFTTKPVGEGMGLGLAICHHIVSELGGEIEIESEPGEGTLVRVALPAARAREHAAPAPSAARRCRLLVICDDAVLARAIRRMLEPDHLVAVAASGADALRALADAAFDVVLCDATMPDVMGGQLSDEMARRWPALARRMVFMTGGDVSGAAAEALRRAGSRFLHKPFPSSELRAVVHEALVRA